MRVKKAWDEARVLAELYCCFKEPCHAAKLHRCDRARSSKKMYFLRTTSENGDWSHF